MPKFVRAMLFAINCKHRYLAVGLQWAFIIKSLSKIGTCISSNMVLEIIE